MTRAQEIYNLRCRIAQAQAQHKRKTVGILMARLASLMTRQLRAENKMDRRKAA